MDRGQGIAAGDREGGCTVILLRLPLKKEDAVKAMKQGAADYVVKLFDPEELLLRLKRELERKISRIGSTGSIPVDIRIIAATNRELEEMVTRKLFREDLFYRLNVMHRHLPPPARTPGRYPSAFPTFSAAVFPLTRPDNCGYGRVRGRAC
jgi:DNA-binding NtrC family response regulator